MKTKGSVVLTVNETRMNTLIFMNLCIIVMSNRYDKMIHLFDYVVDQQVHWIIPS